MTDRTLDRRNELAAFTMLLLRRGDRYLMLHRSPEKAFAPGRWTGIGGRVEPHELCDLYPSALRELNEETGIDSRAVRNFTLRRALLQIRPGYPVTVLLYLTGETDDEACGATTEGTLHWLTAAEIELMDVIENTAVVIPLLMEDMLRDPVGEEPLVTGSAAFSPAGELRSLVWSG